MDEYLLKVVIIGSSNVGKSSLLMRYVDDKFTESHITAIGVDFRIKTLIRENVIAKLQLWDTAGQERFRNIVSLFYRGAEGLVIVYDVTNEESFKKVPSWLEEANLQSRTDCVKILVGNKTDLSYRVVEKQAAQDFADRHGIRYMETSARTADHVCELFDLLAETILKKKIEQGLPPLNSSIERNSISIQTTGDLEEASWCSWAPSSCWSE